jgi:hypothetical protein
LVQTLPSSQAAVLATCVQPVAAEQASVVQTLLSSQVEAFPSHLPVAAQASPLVQTLPSSQTAPTCGAWAQPVVFWQESAVHGFKSLQSTVAPAPHWTPPLSTRHFSPAVHASASSHGRPGLADDMQPAVASQMSSVQTDASAHAVLLGVWMQPWAGTQASTVQLTASAQSNGTPMQLPNEHTSPPVHKLASSQAVPAALGALTQAPVAGTHWFFKQAVSPVVLQVITLPALVLQVPPWHVEMPLQRLPSSLQSASVPQKQVFSKP